MQTNSLFSLVSNQENMDMHKINHQMKGKRSRKSRGGFKKPCEKDAMKVVYISTPMKVKTSASKFREIVQELTGRESDVVKIMEKCDGNNNNNNWMIPGYNNSNINKDGDYYYYEEEELIKTRDGQTVQLGGVMDSKTSGSSSSEEFIDQFNGVIRQFDNPYLLYDSFYNQIDVLGSY